jgi:hypothetical protein
MLAESGLAITPVETMGEGAKAIVDAVAASGKGGAR